MLCAAEDAARQIWEAHQSRRSSTLCFAVRQPTLERLTKLFSAWPPFRMAADRTVVLDLAALAEMQQRQAAVRSMGGAAADAAAAAAAGMPRVSPLQSRRVSAAEAAAPPDAGGGAQVAAVPPAQPARLAVSYRDATVAAAAREEGAERARALPAPREGTLKSMRWWVKCRLPLMYVSARMQTMKPLQSAERKSCSKEALAANISTAGIDSTSPPSLEFRIFEIAVAAFESPLPGSQCPGNLLRTAGVRAATAQEAQPTKQRQPLESMLEKVFPGRTKPEYARRVLAQLILQHGAEAPCGAGGSAYTIECSLLGEIDAACRSFWVVPY